MKPELVNDNLARQPGTDHDDVEVPYGQWGLCVMRSVEETGISVVLVSPGVLCPDFTIEIDEQHGATLALGSADDAVVMAIVTLRVRPRPTFSARSS